jgi:hypothetical protein
MGIEVDLEAEFWRSIERARLASVAPMLARLELSRHMQWGLAKVAWWGDERRYWEPAPDGRFAIVAPVVEDCELVDLCAIELPGQHTGLRLGLARLAWGLGLDAVEKARFGCCDLGLLERPLDWLTDPVDTCWLADLRHVAIVLDGVEEFSVKGHSFAQRVRSLLAPSARDRVLVAE